jgi:KUP system potassium uptake protein
MHSLKHFKVLHEQNIVVCIVVEKLPRVDDASRVSIETLSSTFTLVTARYGFMESPNVPYTLALCRAKDLKFEIMSTSFFVSRRAMKAAEKSELPGWQQSLFIGLARNASNASDYFSIPTVRVVEIGTQLAV